MDGTDQTHPASADCPGLGRDETTASDPEGTLSWTLLVRDGFHDRPVAGAQVVAFISHDEPFRFVFDADPFFNECIVAMGVSDADGRIQFKLRDLPMHFAFDGSDVGFTSEALFDVAISERGSAVLDIYPEQVSITWEGSYERAPLIGQPAEVRNALFGPDDPIVSRFGAFTPKSTLTWTNAPLSWADLYLGLAVGDEAMFTDAFFNDEQDANSGAVEEDDFGQWVDFYTHRCQAIRDGLSLVVYEVEDAVTVTPVAFTWTLELALVGPHDTFTKSSHCASPALL